MTYEPGQQVDGLRIEREIGRGSFGVVYLARDVLIGRSVALKVIRDAGGAVPEDLRERALTEARLIGNLQSPHVVTLYRLRADGEELTQEMEYVEGGSLEDRLEENRPIPVPEAVRVFRGVCLALKAAHASRVIHGDVKPANVLFGPDDLVKLADFGVARMLGEALTPVDLGGRSIGTPLYMAPEVLSGRSAGIPSDLWSAHVLLYRLLSGRLPFLARDTLGLMRAVLRDEPEPIAEPVPGDLAALALRGLAKAEDRRPASAEVVLRELDELARVDETVGPVGRRPTPSNLVPLPTRFIAREEEMETLRDRLLDDAGSLVTVLGPGGMGKTRLARELAIGLLDRFPGGVWFVDLTPLDTGAGIAHAVAEALGIADAARDDAADAVADALRFREPTLLVLDNFEHVIARAAETVGLWRQAAPHARFLVTSRGRLRLKGEEVFELAPLAAPPPDARLPTAAAAREFAAVRLFEDRARAADPAFEFPDDAAPAVARVVSGLDGLPLAIELAAARAAILDPARIAERLDRKFQLLRSTDREIPERHRTLFGAIDWSYDLLPPEDREVFLAASVFRGGFTIEAAEVVLDPGDAPDAPLILDVLMSLREQSLLTVREEAGERRLGMYPSILEYAELKAREELDGTSLDRVRARHACHYLDHAERWGGRIPGPRDDEAMDRLLVESGNLRAARDHWLRTGATDGATRIVLAAAEAVRVRRPPARLSDWVGSIGAAEPDRRSRLATWRAVAARTAGDWEAAAGLVATAVREARGPGSPEALAAALLEAAELHRVRGDLPDADAEFAEAEEIARTRGDRRALALAVGGRGMVAGMRGEMGSAWDRFREATGIAREIGDRGTLALHVHNLGVVHERRGELDSALACYEEEEDTARRIGDRVRTAVALSSRGNALAQAGRLDDALRVYGEAEDALRSLGAKPRLASLLGDRGSVHAMRGEPAEAIVRYEEAEALSRELADRHRLAVLLGRKGRLLGRSGARAEAVAVLEEAESLGREVEDRFTVARSLCDRGGLLRRMGEHERAAAALDEGLAIYEGIDSAHGVFYLMAKIQRAAVARDLGRKRESKRLAREARTLAGELSVTADHPEKSVREVLRLLAEL